MTRRLAVPASGTGSLLRAIAEEVPIHLVVTDRECKALEIAAELDIPSILLPRAFSADFDREIYTRTALDVFRGQGIELIAMAGFMTVFAPLMFEPDAYQLKILNTHPALLPAFKGSHAVRDAIEYGVRISGCTIHWATADLDAGPILLQEAVPVITGDTEESLHERIKQVERVVYPKLLKELLYD